MTRSFSGRLQELLELLEELNQARISYQLCSVRPEAVMVQISVPGERWEVEFMRDGGVEIETFRSSGEIGDGSLLSELFARFSD